MNDYARLDDRTFQQFADLIYKEAGIHLAAHKQALVSARLGKRMRALNINAFDDYYDYVLHDGSQSELSQLLDAISTNVTYFFREPDHFEVLRTLARDWARQGQNRFRLWCAAASTGEEPYTIALTLSEALDDIRDVKVLATDISTTVLNTARKGEYTAKKLETISRKLIHQYFTPVNARAAHEKTYRVNKQLRDMIKFSWLNLSAPPFPMRGPLDVIFCRNVMIYFDNTVRQRLIDEMYRLLKPGGYLMVGHAESLSGLTSQFKSVRPSVYIKK
ncbi:MAG: CheR family methyltransferase [Thermodesulfobacteriota bacterium]